jgi:hypothetical protein
MLAAIRFPTPCRSCCRRGRPRCLLHCADAAGGKLWAITNHVLHSNRSDALEAYRRRPKPELVLLSNFLGNSSSNKHSLALDLKRLPDGRPVRIATPTFIPQDSMAN